MTDDAFMLVKFWVDIVQFVALVVGVIAGWFLFRFKANRDAIAKLAEQVGSEARRIDRVENELEHLPGHHEIGEIHEKINEVGSSVREMKGELGGFNKTLNLIHETMLKNWNASE